MVGPIEERFLSPPCVNVFVCICVDEKVMSNMSDEYRIRAHLDVKLSISFLVFGNSFSLQPDNST